MSVTMEDVAKHAGVSKKTVSRVVNREPNVVDSTKIKVKNSISILGYHPNISARRLASNRSHIIGLIAETSDHYLSSILGPIIHIGQEYGYSIMIVLSFLNDSNNDDILNLIMQKQIDGFILIPPCDTNNILLGKLRSLNFPHTVIASSKIPKSTPYVICDDESGAFNMTNYLISLGHSKIGFVKGPLNHYASQERLLGFKKALKKNNIKINSNWVVKGDFTFGGGVVAGNIILNNTQRPSAIFASNDDTAAGILSVAYEIGLRIPEELSVAGFDDFHLAKRVWPQLTTLHQPVDKIAQQAFKILMSLIEGHPLDIKHVKFPVDLIVRGSTGLCKS